MMTGKKSRTADPLTGIREGQTTNRAKAGSGNRGRRVNLRVAVDGSTIIRNAPFVHSVSVLCPSRLQRNPPVPNPCAFPVVKNFGNNIPEGDPLAVLLAAADKIGWLGRDSLAAFLQSAQGKSKTKATTPEHELAQKESEYNKASANERLLEKKLQKSTETVEKLRKQLQSEQDMPGRLGPALSQAKETTEQSLDELRVMRTAVHGAGADVDKNAPRPAPLWSKTLTPSNKRSGCSMNLQRGQGRNQTWTTQPSLNASTGCWAKPTLFLKNSNPSDIINIDPCL